MAFLAYYHKVFFPVPIVSVRYHMPMYDMVKFGVIITYPILTILTDIFTMFIEHSVYHSFLRKEETFHKC